MTEDHKSRGCSFVLAAALAAAAMGCRLSLVDLHSQSTTVVYYRLPSVPTPNPERTGGVHWCRDRVLMVREFTADEGLDEGFLSVWADGRVVVDQHHLWVEPPALQLGGWLHRRLLDSGLFDHVVGDRSAVRADIELHGHVHALERSVDAEGNAAAVLRVSTALVRRRRRPGSSDRASAVSGIVWRGNLTCSQPLPPDAGPEDFVAATGRNLADLARWMLAGIEAAGRAEQAD